MIIVIIITTTTTITTTITITIIISIRITARGFGYPRALGRPDRPRPTHFDRLGLSESLAESPETPRVAPSGSTGPLRATKVD